MGVSWKWRMNPPNPHFNGEDADEALCLGLAWCQTTTDDSLPHYYRPALVVNLQFPATVLDKNTWGSKQGRSAAFGSSNCGTRSAAAPQSSLLASQRHLLWALGRLRKAPFRPIEPAANGRKWWDNFRNKPVQTPWQIYRRNPTAVSKCGTPFHSMFQTLVWKLVFPISFNDPPINPSTHDYRGCDHLHSRDEVVVVLHHSGGKLEVDRLVQTLRFSWGCVMG